jgi:Glucodextranase, domain B
MIRTRDGSRKLIRWGSIGLVLIIVVGYALFAFRDIVRGPTIIVTEPTDGETYSTTTLMIRGTAERTQSLTLNGKPMLIDDDSGSFQDAIVLFPGYNVETIQASDRFGHVTERRLTLMLDLPPQAQPLPHMQASTTLKKAATTTDQKSVKK